MKISFLARGLAKHKRNHDLAVNFLVSLDFLVKGLLSHWSIKLNESPKYKAKSEQFMKGLDIKFPILIGD